jgi:hypothetical protein
MIPMVVSAARVCGASGMVANDNQNSFRGPGR